MTDSNTDRSFRFIINEIGFPQDSLTPIYEYNDPLVNIVISSITTKRTRHIGVRLFTIQGWK